MTPALSIIIINWKSVDYLRQCLRSVYANTTDITFEIIVVDNASYDGCDEMLGREFPEVMFIQSRENLGFAKSNNLAFGRSRANAVLFLNPDTEIVGSALGTMLAQLQKLPKAGAVGAKLLNSDGSIQTSCIQSFPTVLNQALDLDILRDRFPNWKMWGVAPLWKRTDEPSAVEGISGACVMLKRDVFQKLGGFETSYFMYGEDIDLSFRVSRAGYGSFYVPTASVVHHGGGSSRSAKSNFAVINGRQSVWHFFRLRRRRVAAALYRITQAISALIRLPMLYAIMFLKRGKGAGAASKWGAILRWSFGMTRTERNQTTVAPAPVAVKV